MSSTSIKSTRALILSQPNIAFRNVLFHSPLCYSRSPISQAGSHPKATHSVHLSAKRKLINRFTDFESSVWPNRCRKTIINLCSPSIRLSQLLSSSDAFKAGKSHQKSGTTTAPSTTYLVHKYGEEPEAEYTNL